jgi:TRAP-type mannitol/chloroaromatic compound transport system substrate-binding protein
LLTAAGASTYVALRQSDEEPSLASAEAEETTDTTIGDQSSSTTAAAGTTDASANDGLPVVEWDMPTSWPTSLPVLWGNTELFTQRVSELTNGRFRITPAPAGELSSPIEVLDVVNGGQFSAGSTASYYYVEQSPVAALATAVPFGLTMRQHVSWLYYGGGLELLQQHFADRFNVIQFPAGNTGAQMGGWFRNEITGLTDLENLKMRIPGLGGRVMERLGVEVINLGAADIRSALASGEVDAAEFVGPYDDSRLGLQESAGFYYYPGFWEPGASLDVVVNLDQWNQLPAFYQSVFRSAAFETMVRVTAEYDARNGQALNDLVASGTELREFPADILQAGEAASGLILDEIADGDAEFAAILEQWRGFRRQVTPWFSLAEAGSIR